MTELAQPVDLAPDDTAYADALAGWLEDSRPDIFGTLADAMRRSGLFSSLAGWLAGEMAASIRVRRDDDGDGDGLLAGIAQEAVDDATRRVEQAYRDEIGDTVRRLIAPETLTRGVRQATGAALGDAVQQAVGNPLPTAMQDELVRATLALAQATHMDDIAQAGGDPLRDATAFGFLGTERGQGYLYDAMVSTTAALAAIMARSALAALSGHGDVTQLVADVARQAGDEAVAVVPTRPAFVGGQGLVPNDRLMRGLVVAVQDAADKARNWKSSPADGRPYYSFGPANYTITPDDHPTPEEAWHAVMRLDDDHAVVAVAALAHWLANKGADPVTKLARITVDDLLAMTGTPKHHKGGWRLDDKMAMSSRMLALGSIWVEGRGIDVTERDERGRKRRVKRTPEGRYIVVSTRLKRPTLTGETLYDEFYFRPGDWAHAMLADETGSHEYARMAQAVLRYRSGAGRYPLRLGLYLVWQFRVRAHARTYRQPFVVDRLVGEAALAPSPSDIKNPGRYRGTVERALADLKADGIIGAWGYVGDGDELAPDPPGLPKRGWFEQWRQARLVILPPDDLVQAYASIGKRRLRSLPPPAPAQGASGA